MKEGTITMVEDRSTLDVFYRGWQNYQTLLIQALAPLSLEQLGLQGSLDYRSVGTIVLHIIGARGRWLHNLMGLGDEEFAAFAQWDRGEVIPRSAAELVSALEKTWSVMQEALAAWTPADMQVEYERHGERFTRQWVIWHLIEHDIHHGGEVSLLLGMHGLAAPDL